MLEDDQESALEAAALVTSFLAGGWEACLAGLKAPTTEVYFENRPSLPVARLNTDCSGGGLFELTTGELLWRTPDDLVNDSYYIFDEDVSQWLTFNLPPADCMSCDLLWLIQEVETTAARYLTPIEDVIILVEGKDFDGVESSQVLAGAFLIIEIVPGGKVVRPLKRLISGGVKSAKKVFVIINKSKVAIGEVANNVFKPYKWIDNADEVVDVLENQRYLDEAGNEITGALEVVTDASGNAGVRVLRSWLADFPKLAAKLSDWEVLEFAYEQVDDVIKITSKNGDELGKVIKEGGEEVFEIGDDFFLEGTGSITKQFDMKVVSNAGDDLVNAALVKIGDQVGFIEDVSSYGVDAVKNVIKKRGALTQNCH